MAKKITTVLSAHKSFIKMMDMFDKCRPAPFVVTVSDIFQPTIYRLKDKTFSAREYNAAKRIVAGKAVTSPFAKVTKQSAQSFRIDVALSEFHTELELTKLPSLSDCSLARIRSHVAYLKKHYSNFCKIEQNGKKFRFVTV